MGQPREGKTATKTWVKMDLSGREIIAWEESGARLSQQWLRTLRGAWLVPLFTVTAGSTRPCSSRKCELLKCSNSRKAFALRLIQYPLYSSWFFLLLRAELFSFDHRWDEGCSCPWPCQQVTTPPATLQSFPSQPVWKWRPDPPWGFWMTTDSFQLIQHSLVLGAAERRGGMRREKAFLAATFT